MSDPEHYDCFLSHNSRDKPAVRALADALRGRGISVWLDEECLRPGLPWQPGLEDAIRASRSVAVLVGASGIGPWQDQELRAALSRAVREGKPVIPVLLPDAPVEPELPPFLEIRTWVDMRQAADPGAPPPLDRLIWGITGAPPGRTAPPPPVTTARQVQGRAPLTIELTLDAEGLRRVFRVGGWDLLPPQPAVWPRGIEDLRRLAGHNLPSGSHALRVGKALYQLLFGGPDGDLFRRLAGAADWDLAPGAAAAELAVAAEIRLAPGAADPDPWPLCLPWHLTAVDADRPTAGVVRLTERGWTFETVPPGLVLQDAQDLGREPSLLLLIDAHLEGAAAHAARLVQLIDRTFDGCAEVAHCRDLEQVRERAARAPWPQVLYVHWGCVLPLEALAEALGGALPLVVLNLIGETPPAPPRALVAGRKVLVAVHADHEADRARAAGIDALGRFLTDPEDLGYQRHAAAAFGPRVRLWSGCTGIDLGRLRATTPFRQQFIKLVLDRLTARQSASSAVLRALARGRSALGLIAVGTARDHPELLPKQVWKEYLDHRDPESRDDIRPFPLATGPMHWPEHPQQMAQELLVRLAEVLECEPEDWLTWLTLEAQAMNPGDRLILSLEWRLNSPLEAADAAGRRAWLEAWLELGLRAPREPVRPGVLLVHWLIITTGDDGEATHWAEEAQDCWRERSARPDAAAGHFSYLRLGPLSDVPVEDLEYFFQDVYPLSTCDHRLLPFPVARWVHERTGGRFAETVRLVEELHETGFQRVCTALFPAGGQDDPRG